MFLRIILFSTLLLVCGGTAVAQRPGPEFWRKVACQPFEPRTKLESFDDRYGAVILKGFTRLRTVEISGLRFDAIEIREIGNVSRAKGLVVVMLEGERNRALVDYEEIDPLLNAIDVLSRVDESATKLAGFEATYRTHGDLEISVFRQTRSGTAVRVTSGICEPTTVNLSLDDLAKVRALILEAKMRLDEIR